MSSSNIKNFSNTININAQYISESASLKTENESLKEQIRYYKNTSNNTYLISSMRKMLKEQLLKNFPTFIRTLIVNYTTKKHSVR